MKVIFASDHAGFTLKEILRAHVATLGYEVEDMGAHMYDVEDDYPDVIRPAAKRVAELGSEALGIILGGSGQGEAIIANRVPGIRAVVYYGAPAHGHGHGADIIVLSREHNDANVLSLGARFLSEDDAKDAVTLWLETKFSSDERHVRRIAKID